jgi:hypothetical protein
VCKDLRSLTLHVGYDKECIQKGKTSGRDLSGYFSFSGAGDVPVGKGKTDEGKLGGIVGRVAQAFPGLQHLQLGG